MTVKSLRIPEDIQTAIEYVARSYGHASSLLGKPQDF